METKVTATEKIFEQVEKYSKTCLEILELKLVAKSADVFSTLSSGIIILVVVTLFSFVLSIGLSLFIGQFLVEEYYGFFVVALAYLIILLLMYYNKSKWVKEPIKNLLISTLLKQEKEETVESIT